MSNSNFRYTLTATDAQARAGVLATPHGAIETPVFMPVGTRATVKGIIPQTLEDVGAQIILANAYHLYLRPGAGTIQDLGGLHRFANWHHPILTDSGGFQIFSLQDTLKLDDDGVTFRSIIDGAYHRWTPEDNMRIQGELGADIIMQLDQCAPYPATYADVAKAVERSAQWAARCRASQQNAKQALFGIVQGGTHRDLRLQSVEALLQTDAEVGAFEGFGIGGYSVGEPHSLMFETLGDVTDALPSDRPRYLMGVGNPTTLLKAVAVGVDMFDCVLPTRTARMGTAFSHQGRLNLRNACFAKDSAPLDDQCNCQVCQGYERAYLHHLIKSKEMLGAILLSTHNLFFLIDLMRQARQNILVGTYQDFLNGWMDSQAADDY